MVPDDEAHPGVLVVVRTIVAAEEFVRDANAWAATGSALGATGSPALLDHSRMGKRRPTTGAREQAPVLVVTHNQYERALDALRVQARDRYERVTRFRTGQRRLVIVDETIAQVSVARLSLEQLYRLQNWIDPAIWVNHLRAYEVIQSVVYALILAPPGNHVLGAEALLAKAGLSATEADARLVTLWTDVELCQTMPRDDRRKAGEAITALRRHLAAYRWTENTRAERLLLGTRLLLPPDTGQVVFSATARLDPVFTARPDLYTVVPVPTVRDYRTVNLHVARTRKTGKFAMQKHGAKISRAALRAVLAHYGRTAARARRVLVVTHQVAEEVVLAQWAKVGFKQSEVAHWGRLDGMNAWRDCDTLVMLSLPWLRHSSDLATYLAVSGREPDELENLAAEVRAVREAGVASAIGQAIGRIRLRRMVAPDGTCEPCDVFLRIPHQSGVHADTDRLLAGVQRALPGMALQPWVALSEPRTPDGAPPVARTAVQDALLTQASAVSPGDRRELDRGTFSRMSWNRGLADAQREGHALHRALTKLNVRLEPGGYRAGVRGQVPAALVRADATGQYPAAPVGVTRSRAERKREQRKRAKSLAKSR